MRALVRVLLVAGAVLWVLAGLRALIGAPSFLGLGRLGRAAPPTVTHEMVVERVRDVAKLVSTELTVRDVVTYEQQNRFGLEKRTLLVVTGRVLAGIDLQKGTDVRIDSTAHRITIVLPPAEILAVDVVNVRTYDEKAGLLFPFQPEDRDAIQRQVRNKLIAAGQQSGLLPQATRSAQLMLQSLFTRDGYTVSVEAPPRLQTAPAR